jgi:hypothetical protein
MFCGSPGVTKAHVFARSFTTLFDDPDDPEEHEVRHDYVDPDTGERRVIKRARTFALTARRVCGNNCNSGWLRELEEEVRPIIEHIAWNKPLELDENQQAVLALWTICAVLISFEMPTVIDEHRFADPALANEVYAERRPPVGTQIWLGANPHGEMGWLGSRSLTVPGSTSNRRPFGMSLSFGYAILHTVYHGESDRLIRLHYHPHRALKQIWPPQRRVEWPPPLLIRPRDMSPLAYEIANNSAWTPMNTQEPD